MVRLIGLAGPIACGKSTVAKHLEKLGCGLVSEDDILHELISDDDSGVQPKVLAICGDDVFDDDGHIDPPKLSAKLHASPELLTAFNRAMWWPVFTEILRRTWSYMCAGHRQIMIDSRLIMGFLELKNLWASGLLFVVAPPELQFTWLVARDGLADEEAKAQTESGLEEAQAQLAAASFVMENKGSLSELEAKIQNFSEKQPAGWTLEELRPVGLAVCIGAAALTILTLAIGLALGWQVAISSLTMAFVGAVALLVTFLASWEAAWDFFPRLCSEEKAE
eukprot:TRINITY_DN31804_c0_g1_i1.p1 TRINITY_DN31804_c0_g1~~TRINITY_DN31804_c0_g1_i1.p1  ORF type:complete len:279 (-),score=67.06 TRINITY_DN31804_c0_g1_i1:119-955(-)